MKVFVFVFVLIVMFSEVKGQVVQTIGPLTCYVGDTYDIVTIRDTVKKSDFCKEGTHTCIYGFVQWFYPKLGIYKWPTYLVNGSGTHELKYTFYDTVTFRDSVVASYKMSETGPNCGHSCSYGLYDTVFLISGVVKRDSVVKIRSSNKNDILFILDSSLHAYKTYTFNTSVYNHVNDVVVFSDFSIEEETGIAFNVTVLKDSIVSNTFTSSNNEGRIPLQLLLTTNELPTFIRRELKAKLVAKVKTSTDEYLINDDLNIILPPDFVSSAKNLHSSRIDLVIIENPVVGRLQVSSYTDKCKEVSISIFDELGREVRRVHDGFLDVGEHEFSAELPAGMYYVRMQAGDEVLTRKVTVVR